MPIIIDKKQVLDFIMRQVKQIDDLSNKELILMVMAIEHISMDEQTKRSINLGVGITTGALTSIFVPPTSPLLFASGLTVAIATLINAFGRHRAKKELDEIRHLLSTALLVRFEDPITAYFQTAQLITSIEREDLLDFFERAGATNE